MFLRPCNLLALALAAMSAGPLPAADVVWIEAPTPTSRDAKWIGRIEDYTGKELTLRVTGNVVRTFPTESIVRIETPRTSEQVRGDTQLAAGRYRDALASYQAALVPGKETRPWMRREILVQIIWCQRGLGDVATAGKYAVVLYGEDPATQHLDALPVAWGAEADPRRLEREAEAWLADDSPAARLIGASYLLSSASRGRAVAELGRLAAGGDGRLAALAQAQLWRNQLVTARPADIERWQQAVDAMPENLRAGPYFVLGEALARHKQYEAAALALLRVPTLYDRQRTLAVAALGEAGEALKQLGRDDEARRLESQRLKMTNAEARMPNP